MATRKKKELDIEIPTSTRVTPTVSKAAVDSSVVTNKELHDQLVELNTNLKALTDGINSNLDKIHNLTHSSDWKLWKMMNMIELIAKENGYVFSTDQPLEKEKVK
jgi:hypothetical protein